MGRTFEFISKIKLKRNQQERLVIVVGRHNSMIIDEREERAEAFTRWQYKQGTNRGVGGARFVTPDLSYDQERERKEGAKIINGMETTKTTTIILDSRM